MGNLGVKAVPYVAAALVPEVGVPAMAALQGAAGAVDGALTPTTGDGQFARNVAGHALMGGGTAGTMSLVGKGLTGAASRLGTRDAEVVASRQAAADALRAEGLPVNAITLTDTGKNLAARLADNPSVKAFRTQGDEVIAGKVADGLGLSGYRGAIDSEMLNAARPGIKQALDDATNVTLTLPKSLQADLASMLGSTGNPLTKGIASDTTVRTAAANLARAAEDGVAVSGRQLQELASELKSIAQNFNASAAERRKRPANPS